MLRPLDEQYEVSVLEMLTVLEIGANHRVFRALAIMEESRCLSGQANMSNIAH